MPGRNIHLEDLDLDGDNIKLDLKQARWRGMGWIDLAYDRDRRRALLDEVVCCRFSQNAGNSLTR